MPPEEPQRPLITPIPDPLYSAPRTPQYPTAPPPAPPPQKKGWLSRLSKVTTILLLLAIVLFAVFIFGISRGGSGSEIIFIVLAPLFLLAIFSILIIKFIVSTLKLRKATQQGFIPPSTKRKMLIGWVLLGVFAILGVLFIGNYVRVGRATTPIVNNDKALSYIAACKVTGIQRDGLGDGKSIVINLDPKLPEATDVYGGNNYFKSDDSNWGTLVAAVKSAESKCGRISYEDTDKNAHSSWVSSAQAVALLDDCQITQTKLVDNPGGLVDNISGKSLDSSPAEKTGIVLKEQGTYKVLYTDVQNRDSLQTHITANKNSIETRCGNGHYGTADPFTDEAL